MTLLLGIGHLPQLHRASLLAATIAELKNSEKLHKMPMHFKTVFAIGEPSGPAAPMPPGFAPASVGAVSGGTLAVLQNELRGIIESLPDSARGWPITTPITTDATMLLLIVKVYSAVYEVSFSTTPDGWATHLAKKSLDHYA